MAKLMNFTTTGKEMDWKETMKTKNIDSYTAGTDLILKCDCGCNSQVSIEIDKVNRNEDFISINCREDGRSKWHGVVIYTDKIKELRKFLSKRK
jgi:hypothetical protein